MTNRHDIKNLRPLRQINAPLPTLPKPANNPPIPPPARNTITPETRRLAINQISVRPDRRAVDDSNVAALAASMKDIGLRAPITVIIGDTPVLVSGLRRLMAAKKLDWLEIDCIVMEGDEIDARLWEIAENLFRTDYKTALERDEHVAEYVKLIAQKAGQIVHPSIGGRQPHDKGIAKAARDLPVPGKTEEARRKSIERSIRVASINPDAKSAATAAGLANRRSALLEIGEQEPEAQLAKVQEIKNRPRARRNVEDVQKESMETSAHRAIADTVDRIQTGANPISPPTSPIKEAENAPVLIQHDTWEPGEATAARSPSTSETSATASSPQFDTNSHADSFTQFARFVLARINRQGEIIVITVSSEDMAKFTDLEDRVRSAIAQKN